MKRKQPNSNRPFNALTGQALVPGALKITDRVPRLTPTGRPAKGTRVNRVTYLNPSSVPNNMLRHKPWVRDSWQGLLKHPLTGQDVLSSQIDLLWPESDHRGLFRAAANRYKSKQLLEFGRVLSTIMHPTKATRHQ